MPLGTCATAKAWGNTKSKGENNDEEQRHKHGDVNQTDNLPALEPYLTVHAECLHGTPETVREMEPNSNKPDDIKHHEDRI